MPIAIPDRATALLASLTPQQLAKMRPADRQALCDQCERVYREIRATRIVSDAQEATSEPGGVIALLKRGDRTMTESTIDAFLALQAPAANDNRTQPARQLPQFLLRRNRTNRPLH